MQDYFYLFHNYCKENNIVSEFVRFNPWLKTEHGCNGFLEVSFWNQVVAIDLAKSKEEIWSEFDSKNRNRIRKSKKCGVVIEQDLSFTYLDEIHLYNVAYNQSYQRYSPGHFLFHESIRQAIQQKKKTVDFLRGGEKYKYDFGAQDSKIWNLDIRLGEHRT